MQSTENGRCVYLVQMNHLNFRGCCIAVLLMESERLSFQKVGNHEWTISFFTNKLEKLCNLRVCLPTRVTVNDHQSLRAWYSQTTQNLYCEVGNTTNDPPTHGLV
jgi:hypothetical protein